MRLWDFLSLRIIFCWSSDFEEFSICFFPEGILDLECYRSTLGITKIDATETKSLATIHDGIEWKTLSEPFLESFQSHLFLSSHLAVDKRETRARFCLRFQVVSLTTNVNGFAKMPSKTELQRPWKIDLWSGRDSMLYSLQTTHPDGNSLGRCLLKSELFTRFMYATTLILYYRFHLRNINFSDS